jgi:hypothetical protein
MPWHALQLTALSLPASADPDTRPSANAGVPNINKKVNAVSLGFIFF